MDLRGGSSSSPAATPGSTMAIPRARQPLQALIPSSSQLSDGGWDVDLRLDGRRESPGFGVRRVAGIAEAALLVIGMYVLIGAGIGAAAGAVLVGVMAGAIAGVCAVAAILLIRGSAMTRRHPVNDLTRVRAAGR